MRGLFYVFRRIFFRLFGNFLRINPQLVVQKLPGHKYTISEFAMSFCRWGKHNKFWEKIKLSVQAVNKLLKMATLSEHTASFWGSLTNYFHF